MFRESFPIIYEAPADLKKWPSLNGERLNGKTQPYLVFNGTLADCIRELLAKPVKGISLYDIVTSPHRRYRDSQEPDARIALGGRSSSCCWA